MPLADSPGCPMARSFAFCSPALIARLIMRRLNWNNCAVEVVRNLLHFSDIKIDACLFPIRHHRCQVLHHKYLRSRATIARLIMRHNGFRSVRPFAVRDSGMACLSYEVIARGLADFASYPGSFPCGNILGPLARNPRKCSRAGMSSQWHESLFIDWHLRAIARSHAIY